MRSRALAALAIFAALVGALLVGAGSAQATTTQYSAGIVAAYQHRDGNTVVSGWVYDRTDRSRYVWACLWSMNRCQRVFKASMRTPDGRPGHGYRVVLSRAQSGNIVLLRHAPTETLAGAWVSTPGSRIVTVARREVGDRYVWGGASPSGFDCSGLAMWSYRHANVANLPHQSEQQRWSAYMHPIWRSSARPGDLVFYLSGGRAYHVAIYAGNNAQYSATNPAAGVRYEHIWASNVEFRTDWH